LLRFIEKINKHRNSLYIIIIIDYAFRMCSIFIINQSVVQLIWVKYLQGGSGFSAGWEIDPVAKE